MERIDSLGYRKESDMGGFTFTEMAKKYKLTYFNAKGIAEPIRFLLAYLEEDFEDVRFEYEDWGKFKEKTPFGRVPVLEEDGKQLTQSNAICRYLGHKAGLSGANMGENLQIDIIADTIADMRSGIPGFLKEKDVDIQKQKRDHYIQQTLPFYLLKFEEIARQNDGYLANKKLSWVDFIFATSTDPLIPTAPLEDSRIEKYPNLHQLKKRVFHIPQIQKWIEKRPNTEY